MTNSKMNYILAGIGALIVGLLLGLYLAPRPAPTPAGATPAGGTTSGQTFASVVLPMSGTATSTSVLNNTGNDLIITNVRIACQGLGTALSYVTGSGIASLTVSFATTSTANPITTRSNTNTVGGVSTSFTIATSTGNFTLSSTTSSGTGSAIINNTWLAGSYLTAYFSATTTGQCTGAVDTVSS